MNTKEAEKLKKIRDLTNEIGRFIMDNYIHDKADHKIDGIIYNIQGNNHKNKLLIDQFRREHNLDNDFKPLKESNNLFG